MLITHATLPDGRTGIDVLVQGGRIAALGPKLAAPAGIETIDAAGQLLSPPFVDAHFHMDATLSYGLPRVNASGTLLEGIALWGELKPQLTQQALVERALQYCDWAVAKGLLAIRSHVDVCDPRLLAVRGTWQRDVDSGGEVRHLVAHQLKDLTPLLGRLGQLSSKSRDFH